MKIGMRGKRYTGEVHKVIGTAAQKEWCSIGYRQHGRSCRQGGSAKIEHCDVATEINHTKETFQDRDAHPVPSRQNQTIVCVRGYGRDRVLEARRQPYIPQDEQPEHSPHWIDEQNKSKSNRVKLNKLQHRSQRTQSSNWSRLHCAISNFESSQKGRTAI